MATRRPYVGCTADAAWQRAGLSEASIFDVYEIGGLLGSGTFGQVRLCWPVNEAEEGGKYAVKVVDMKSEVFRQATAFISARQEASILKAVKHPHIVELVDVFEKDRWLFLVLECIPGGELFTALSNPQATVTENCVATCGLQLFAALRHLHEQCVVHRDVKAENILLTSNPAKTRSWHVKLIDFGLATRVEQPLCLFQLCKDQEVPLEELICGTPYYCSPEVWVNDYGPKVDVWAAGVVLYLALLGTFPFYDDDTAALESIICNYDKKPSFQAVCTKECPDYQISAAAQWTLRQLLSKEQENRPNAAGAMALPWMQTSKSAGQRATMPRRAEQGDDCSHPRQGAVVDQGAGGHEGSSRSCGDEQSQVIPVPIRAKAGRAAARPPVDPSKEQSRTKALEAMKRRANVGGSALGSKLSESTDWDSGGGSPLSRRSCSTVDLWTRSPNLQTRELGAECTERRGAPPLPRETVVLCLAEHDVAPTDASLTDSDVDDLAAVCACR